MRLGRHRAREIAKQRKVNCIGKNVQNSEMEKTSNIQGEV